MDKPRQGNTQKLLNEKYLIKSERTWWREITIGFFTLLVWVYSLTVVYFFIDALFSLNHDYPALFRIVFKMSNSEVKGFIVLSIILFTVIFLLLYLWNYYNKRKYGKLNRRKYPKPTTKNDLKNLNMIELSIYQQLQDESVVILEENPIKIRGD